MSDRDNTVNIAINNNHYDVILIGSGTCSSTIARELVSQNRKILILEQGKNIALKDTISSFVAVAKEFVVGKNLNATTAITAGGATSVYFGVCKLPSSEAFNELGINLSAEFEQVKKELPINELPDEFLPPQSLAFRASATQLGYKVKKNLMLIDKSKCIDGNYNFNAKWKAKNYLEEAVSNGAELITEATVTKIIIKDNQAVGVEYKTKDGVFGSRNHQAFGTKIVLGAGVFATPKLLIDAGITSVGNRGFFCKPGFMVCGTLPDLKGKDAFVGNLDINMGNGISIGDGTMNSSLFKLVMLANLKFGKLFSHANVVSVGVLLNDSMSGEITKKGKFQKKFSEDEIRKLDEAGIIATSILKNIGAKKIFKTKLVAGIPGGLLKVGDQLDQNLQTKIPNLYVCDHSLILDVNSTPTVSLICLGKYLSKHLLASLKPTSLRDSDLQRIDSQTIKHQQSLSKNNGLVEESL